MKQTFKTLAAAAAMFLAFSSAAMAQDPKEKEASDSALIVFEVGHSDINLKLGNNGKQLDNIFKSLEQAIKEGKVEKVSIQATSSPEGGYDYNMKLSKERANSIINYLTARYPLPERKVEAIAGGVAWDLLR